MSKSFYTEWTKIWGYSRYLFVLLPISNMQTTLETENEILRIYPKVTGI
jgi:hypothetical protein